MSKKISTYTDTEKYRKKKSGSSPSLLEIRKIQAQARNNPSGDENITPAPRNFEARPADTQKLKYSSTMSTELTGISKSSSVVAISVLNKKVQYIPCFSYTIIMYHSQCDF